METDGQKTLKDLTGTWSSSSSWLLADVRELRKEAIKEIKRNKKVYDTVFELEHEKFEFDINKMPIEVREKIAINMIEKNNIGLIRLRAVNCWIKWFFDIKEDDLNEKK